LFAQVEGPILGYLADGEGRVRPMLGLSASAQTGAAFEHDALAWSSISGDLMIARTAAGDTVVAKLSSKGLQLLTAELPAQASAVYWSPTSRAAAIVFADANQIAVIRDAGLASQEVRMLDLPAGSAAFAVSDRGTIAASIDNVIATAVWQSSWSRFTLDTAATALAFDREDIVLATAQSISILRNGTELSTLAAWEESRQIVNVAAAKAAWIGVAKDGTVSLINRADQSVSQIQCGCDPAGLASLGRDVFRLTGITESGIVLLDPAAPELILRVPPPTVAAVEKGEGQ
jgi:hypothetical protein